MQSHHFKSDDSSGAAGAGAGRTGIGYDNSQQRLIIDPNLGLPPNESFRRTHGSQEDLPHDMNDHHFEPTPYSAPAWIVASYEPTTTAFQSTGMQMTSSATADDYLLVDNPIFQQQRSELPPWTSVAPFTTPAGFSSAPAYATYNPFPPYSGSPVNTMSHSPSPIPIINPSPPFTIGGSFESHIFHPNPSRSANFLLSLSPPDQGAVSSGSSSSEGVRKKSRSHSVPAPSRRPSRSRIDGSSGKRSRKSTGRKPFNRQDKDKTEYVRDMGACWRCRRYKKSCDGPGTCKNCSHGRFRVWPESLGCRRGCLEDLVTPVLPPHAADILGPAAQMVFKTPNWRYGMVNMEQRRAIEERLPLCNRWERLDLKVRSTGMYGSEFSSLLSILINYQESQTRPSALLDNSISLLDSACDIYHNFVECAWPREAADITTAISNAQRANASVCKMFLTSALSGKGRDWLPSFLSMCMAFVAVMIIMDAACAVPVRERQQVWGDLDGVSRSLRTGLYPVTIDLLRASSNGSKPFAMQCWSVTRAGAIATDEGNTSLGQPDELIRNEAGLEMLSGDKAAFDGMHALQQWIRRNVSLLELGSRVITSDPFTTPEVPCIAPVLKLFEI